MRTVSTVVCALLVSVLCSASASAQGMGDRIRALHEAAQFERARAAEFHKLANEDQNVAQSRENQARDLENNAVRYAERANFHRSMAAQFGNNPDQVRLARECDALAGEMRRVAAERRNMVGMLRSHVGLYSGWAANMEARAAAYDNQASSLQNAGRL